MGGGVPLTSEGQVIAGVGVSGGNDGAGHGWDEGERFLPDQGDVAATGLAAQRMQAEGFVVFRDHSVEALHEESRILWATRSSV